MKVKIFFFAELKEILGSSRFLEVQEGSTIEEVVNLLAGEFTPLFSKKNSLIYAVNENFETNEKKLKNHDELALMMPMSGG